MDGIDHDTIISLNRASEQEMSPMDRASLLKLMDAAFHVGLRGQGRDAFLIALHDGSRHDGVNFNWFRTRYERFVYVDRIVVAADQRGRGHARSLYDELIAKAAQAGHRVLCCEVNVEPPNEVSLAFHAAMGFAEVGRAELSGKNKVVAYLYKTLGKDLT
jgi:uncharacterized protein